MKKFRFLFFSLLLLSSLLFNGSIFATEKNNQPPSVSDDAIANAKYYENVVDSYLLGLNEKDLEGILSLYADSATVEDPVGSQVIKGIEVLRKFYSGAVTMDLSLMRTGPVRVASSEAAFPFQLRMKVNGVTMVTDIIDHFKFNEEGKIVSMRAFWGPSNRKIATE